MTLGINPIWSLLDVQQETVLNVRGLAVKLRALRIRYTFFKSAGPAVAAAEWTGLMGEVWGFADTEAGVREEAMAGGPGDTAVA